jgi:hypothetical protein
VEPVTSTAFLEKLMVSLTLAADGSRGTRDCQSLPV